MKIRMFQRALDKWPGKAYLGVYRFLPGFFLFGAALEFSMINWHPNGTNFYKTVKKRQAKEFVSNTIQAP